MVRHNTRKGTPLEAKLFEKLTGKYILIHKMFESFAKNFVKRCPRP